VERKSLGLIASCLTTISCAALFPAQDQPKTIAEAEAEARAKRQAKKQEQLQQDFRKSLQSLSSDVTLAKTSTPTRELVKVTRNKIAAAQTMMSSAFSADTSLASKAYTSSVTKTLASYSVAVDAIEFEVRIYEAKNDIADVFSQIKMNVPNVATSTYALRIVRELEKNFGELEKLTTETATLASRDDSFAAFSKDISSKIIALRPDFETSRNKVYITVYSDELSVSTKSLRTLVAKLSKGKKDSDTFEAVNGQLENHTEKLSEVNNLNLSDPALAKIIASAETQKSAAEKKLEALKLVYEVALHKKKVKAGIETLKSFTMQFETTTDESVFEKALEALNALEKSLVEGQKYETKDAAYAGFVNGVRLGIKRGRIGIKKAKAKWPVKKQGNLLTQAADKAEKIASELEKKPSADLMTELRTAKTTISEVLKSGKALESKDLAYLRKAIAQRKALAKYDRLIKKMTSRMVIISQREKVESAVAKVLKLLKESKDDTGLKNTTAAIKEISVALADGKSLESKDLEYLRYAIKQKKKIKELEKKVASKAIALRSEAKQSEIDAAIKAVKSQFEASASPEELDSVLQELVKLENVINRVDNELKKGEEFKTYLAKQSKFVASSKQKIAKKTQAKNIKASKLALETAIAAVQSSVSDAQEPEQFQAAQKAIVEAQKIFSAQKKLSKKSSKFKSYVEEQRKLLKKASKALQSKQNAVQRKEAVIAIEKALEGTAVDAQNVSATLNIASLESAVKTAEGAMKSYTELEKRDSQFKKIMQSRRKQLEATKKAIATSKKQAEVRKAKDEVTIILTAFQESLESAEDKTSLEAAKARLEEIDSKLSSLQTLEKKSKVFKKFADSTRRTITKAKNKLSAKRRKLRVSKVMIALETAKADISEKLASATTEAGLAALNQSVAAASNTLKSNKKLENKSAEYKKFATALRAELKSFKSSAKKNRMKAIKSLLQAEIEESAGKAEAALASATDEDGLNNAVELRKAFVDLLKAKKVQTAKSPVLSKLVSKELARAKSLKIKEQATRKSLRQNAAKVDVEASLADIEQRLESVTDKAGFVEVEKALVNLAEIIRKHSAKAKGDKVLTKFLAETQKNKAKAQKILASRRVAAKVQVHQIELETAKAEAETKTEGLSQESTQKAYQDAANAVSKLSKVIEAGQSIGDSSPKYRKVLATAEKQKNRLRSLIPKRRISVAEAEAESQFAAYKSSLAKDDYENAISAAEKFQNIVRANNSFSGATKKYEKFIAAKLIQAKKLKKKILSERFVSAEKRMQANLEILQGQPESEAFEPVEAAIRSFEAVVREYQNLNSNTIKKLVAKSQKTIDSAKRKLMSLKVKAELARASALVNALDASSVMADFSEAKDGISSLSDTLDEAEVTLRESKKTKALFAKVKKTLNSLRNKVEKQKIVASLAPERNKMTRALVETTATVEELLSALTPENVAKINKAIESMETVIFDASKHDGKSKSFAKFRDKTNSQLDKLKSRLAKQQKRNARNDYKQRLLEEVAKAEEKCALVEGSLDAAVLEKALSALSEARSLAKEGSEYGSGKKHKAFLKKQSSIISKLKKDATKSFISTNKKKMEIDVAGLSAASELEEFQRAQSSIDEYSKSLKSLKKKLGSKSKSANKAINAAQKGLPKAKRQLAEMRVFAAARANKNQMQIMRESGDDDSVDMARATNDVLAKTIRSARESSAKLKKSKKIKKLAARVKSNRLEIEKFEYKVLTRPHRSKLKSSSVSVKEKLTALKGGSIDKAAFANAEKAIAAHISIATDIPVMLRDNKKYKKFLKGEKKRIAGYQKKLSKYRTQGQIAKHKIEVESARGEARTAVKVLSNGAGTEAYQAAEAAVGELIRVVRSGEELAFADKKYRKYLAKVQKSIPGLSKKVSANRIKSLFVRSSRAVKAVAKNPGESAIEEATVAIAEAKKTLDMMSSYAQGNKSGKKQIKSAKQKLRRYEFRLAEAKTKARLALLSSDSEQEAFLAANEAIDALSQKIRASKKAAKKDKKLKALIGKAKKLIPKYRVKVRKRQVQLAFAEATEKLKEAARDPQPLVLYEADEAISDLEEVVRQSKKVTKKNKKFKSYLKTISKRTKKLRKQLTKARLKKARRG